MKATQRRDLLIQTLNQATTPLKATSLAKEFGVSRQIIVGDVAILRASHYDIIATNQGYLLADKATSVDDSRFRGKIVCQHLADQAIEELTIIINHGGYVENVEVDHPYYGLIKASLQIKHAGDIQDFDAAMDKSAGTMLSSLTNGIHLHTITTSDEATFEDIKADLKAVGILLDESI
ncbi:transcription repressor NadR [Aerococcus urinaeequi]|nr:transcription repressor NadR [Aerococcus urinaeequi]